MRRSQFTTLLVICLLSGCAVFVRPKGAFGDCRKAELVLSQKTNQLTASDLGSSFELTASGGDPYVFFDDIGDFCRRDKPHVIAFEYIYAKASGRFNFYCWLKGQAGISDSTGC